MWWSLRSKNVSYQCVYKKVVDIQGTRCRPINVYKKQGRCTFHVFLSWYFEWMIATECTVNPVIFTFTQPNFIKRITVWLIDHWVHGPRVSLILRYVIQGKWETRFFISRSTWFQYHSFPIIWARLRFFLPRNETSNNWRCSFEVDWMWRRNRM